MGHLKRLASPRSWPVHRKTSVWSVRPVPGSHSQETAIPIITALRDVLHVCDTRPEASRIVGGGGVMVDGQVVRDGRRGIGFMDVLTLTASNANYRVLIDRKGKLRLQSIDGDSAKWKLVRITSKTTTRGGKSQLGLHDGRTMLLEDKTARPGDVLKIALPTQQVLGRFAWSPGATAYMTGGSHVGELGKIASVEINRNPKPNVVIFAEGFRTIKPYVFLVGGTTPAISPPEVVT